MIVRQRYSRHTVALADAPAGPVLVHIKRRLFSKRCSTTEDEAHRAKIILVALGVSAHHLDKDWRDESHLLDLEALDSSEKPFEVKLGEDDCLVAVVDTFAELVFLSTGVMRCNLP